MRRFFEPASAPAWLKPVLASIRAALGDVWDAPVRPFQAATAALPPAGAHGGGLAYDTTLDRLAYSNRTAWLTLVDTSGAAFTGNLTVGGTLGCASLSVAGAASFGGSVTLGDAAADAHSVNGSLTLVHNATYLQGKTSGGAATRILGIHGSNNLYFGGIDAGIAAIIFRINATDDMTLSASALNLAAGRALQVAGTQVVAARRTGWGAPTGTATRSAFDTASVTTAQLAERVKALIDDLRTHGLIGN